MKIMKKNILFGVVCVALLTATSCSDFLDVQPEEMPETMLIS